MTCDSVSNLISLYYYGELMPEEEDRLETHLAGCAACARELERQRKLAAALDQRTAAVSPLLLEDCRADLMAAVAGGAPRMARHKGPPDSLRRKPWRAPPSVAWAACASRSAPPRWSRWDFSPPK